MLTSRTYVLGSWLLGASLALAQFTAQKDRIHEPIDSNHRVTLSKLAHPYALPQLDRGPVDPSMKLGYMQILFKPSPQQQAQLEALLVEQQDPFSPNYHKWLTPEQYGERFGLSLNDIQQVQTWLTSQGFSIVRTARSRTWIAFSGTAAQVKNAFGTEIRHYEVDGKLHYANATAPSIPAALEPLVRTILGLNDFHPEPKPVIVPEATLQGFGHVLAPSDLATIYDVNPLYALGVTGAGQKLAIVGQSGIYINDIRNFRTTFGLPANDPQITLVPGSTDPGVTSALGEADLDIEISGGIAPNTKQFYIYADLFVVALLYAVDENIAPVIGESYHICEGNASVLGIPADFAEPLAQQAASEGISIINSSGDAGATDCDAQFSASAPAASHGLQVNMFAAAPDITGVGGTMFDDASGNYWSASGAALSYIPESAWNETSSSEGLAASGGGLSQVYAKPAWQNGAGFPTANQRGVPDIAMSSAAHDGYYITTNGGVAVSSGTSAATPLFAGIVTLLNEYTNTNGQGSLNPNLYRLAQSGTSAFHDVTTGNNIVPCIALSPNCVGGNSSTYGSEGYSAGPGYDLVTGWGSVDAARMIEGWANGQLQTSISVVANPPSVALNGTTTLTATVRAVGSSANPTGTVTFLVGNTELGANLLTASGPGVSTATLPVYASTLPAGNDVITAVYSGDRTFTGSYTTINIGVSIPTSASAVIPSVSPNPVYQRTDAAGTTGWFFTVTLSEVAGVSTSLTGLTIGGQNYTSEITSFFGTNAIPANGTISASLYNTSLSVPTTVLFVFSGADTLSGRTWTQQISVQFLGPQLSGLIQMTGLPSVIEQNPTIQGAYQWCQDMGVAEQNGHTVYLTKFLANGNDFSDQIVDYFGTDVIYPFGSQLTEICWKIGGGVPVTLTYNIDGVDDLGNKLQATLNATFEPPASNPGPLSASTEFLTMNVSSAGLVTSSKVNVSVGQGQAWSVSTYPSNTATNWLTVYPLSGVGPGTLNVSASAAGLSPGLYLATLVFQSPNSIPQYYNTYVYFVVTAPQITQLYNSAWYTDLANAPVDTGIAPGMIFTLKGSGIGPPSPETWYLNDNGDVASDLYGLQVLVNGYAAPLLYIGPANPFAYGGPTQINAIAPYEIANSVGQTATIQVINNGVKGNIYNEKIVATSPGIFSLGNGQAAAFNADGTINGPGNGAVKGSVIALFASGEGQLTPAGVDGSIFGPPYSPVPHPLAPVSVTFAGIPATNITYAGTVPTSFEGFFQVNVQVPPNVPSGTIPVVLTVGGTSSVPMNIVVQ